MIMFKLEKFLEENRITRNELAKQAEIRPNTIYDICANNAKRIELETLDKMLTTLSAILKRQVALGEIVEHQPTDKS